MECSRHNIISGIQDSDKYFVVNLLSRNADILSEQEAHSLLRGEDLPEKDFAAKGYLTDRVEEERSFKRKYLEFLDARDTDEVQIFYAPTYTCNFACSYCYQDEYGIKPAAFSAEITDAFFSYIDSAFGTRRKYLTLFGGEPLLMNTQQKDFLEYFIRKTQERKLEIAIVTNGYFLEEYLPLLLKANIREIQVTLDGVGEVHDERRYLKGKQPSFNKIVKGIDQALANNLPVNLRVVLDKENISNLPVLAQFTIDKGWTSSAFFKTQLGRNYELHHCQSRASQLYSRIEMYEDIYRLMKEYPAIASFHKPAFSISKFLFQEGTLPDPLFDSCPGTKTEWAFDYTGKIYACTATIGKPGEELGTFFPFVDLKTEQVHAWENRDVLSIKECRSCNMQLACGGGCASVAKNTDGNLNAPDCRPVKELLALGISHYFPQACE